MRRNVASVSALFGWLSASLAVCLSVCLVGWLAGKQSLPVCLSVCLYGDYGCLCLPYMAGCLAVCLSAWLAGW